MKRANRTVTFAAVELFNVSHPTASMRVISLCPMLLLFFDCVNI